MGFPDQDAPPHAPPKKVDDLPDKSPFDDDAHRKRIVDHHGTSERSENADYYQRRGVLDEMDEFIRESPEMFPPSEKDVEDGFVHVSQSDFLAEFQEWKADYDRVNRVKSRGGRIWREKLAADLKARINRLIPTAAKQKLLGLLGNLLRYEGGHV